MQTNADVFSRFEDARTNVNVRLEPVARAQIGGYFDEFVDAQRQLHHQDFGGDREPFVVFAELHEEELALGGEPVTANALETAGAVLQSVREQADLGILVRAHRPASVHGDL